MEPTATFKVVDPDSGGVVWVITRVAAGTVAVALAIDNDGDLEVFLPPDVALKLAAALTEAARALQSR